MQSIRIEGAVYLLESTNNFWMPLFYYLEGKGKGARLVDAYDVHQMTKIQSNKAKTYPNDRMAITKFPLVEDKKKNKIVPDRKYHELRKFTRLKQKTVGHLMTISGLAENISLVVYAETGGIKRFKEANAYVSYIGFDVIIVQSGKYEFRGKITKQGNRYLRNAFYQAADVARRFISEYKEYYAKMFERKQTLLFQPKLCLKPR